MLDSVKPRPRQSLLDTKSVLKGKAVFISECIYVGVVVHIESIFCVNKFAEDCFQSIVSNHYK